MRACRNWRHPKQRPFERRGETVITLIPERRILLYVAALIAGVVLATRMPDPGLPQLVLITGAAVLAAVLAWRGMAWRWQVMMVCAVWGLAGLSAASWQLARAPATLATGATASLDGVIERLDGRQDNRLRVWVRVEAADQAGRILTGHLVRLSVRPDMLAPVVGSYLRVRARIYPPPARLLHGARDYALQARVRGVVASGYIVEIRDVRAPSASLPLAVRLGMLRQDRADRIAASMDAPAGGIAAALLIGDRRYVSEEIYDLFRQSGLAHLLAISGLHMGLLCFGVIAFLRLLAALAPSWACQVPVHKVAAVGGVVAGLCYVLLSGLSVSAIRAFLMAMLILAAWLVDRLGLTLRNVGLAAGAILVVNPMAVFGARFQLSFAATTGLVIWFETWRHRTEDGGVATPRILRWVGDLVMASLIASAATTPLTAQHFGTVTPWGVLANLVGIPLTGIWIMPSGLLVLVTQFLPVPLLAESVAVALMETGIDLLVGTAALFAELPVSPLRVIPPGAPLLVISALAGLVLLCWRLPRPAMIGGWAALFVTVTLILLLRPGVDAVVLGQGDDRLILAGQDGGAGLYANQYASRGPQRRALSSFHGDAALRALARHDIDVVSTAVFSQQRAADGRLLTVLMSRRGLTNGCRAGGDLVLSMVVADYPCRDGTPLVSLAGLPQGNFLLWIDRDSVTARAADGQYFRISPVSRP